MGQAKNRGSFEQRQAEAIEREQEAARKREAERKVMLARREAERRAQPQPVQGQPRSSTHSAFGRRYSRTASALMMSAMALTLATSTKEKP